MGILLTVSGILQVLLHAVRGVQFNVAYEHLARFSVGSTPSTPRFRIPCLVVVRAAFHLTKETRQVHARTSHLQSVVTPFKS